jgi:excisionase family DNA binding protein
MRYQPKPVTIEPAMLTVKQASIYAGVCETTLYNLMNRGDLPKSKLGGRTLISKKALNQLLGLEVS